jgi:hypothetical protein
MTQIRPNFLRQYDKSVGPCKYCGKKTHWYNDVPLRAFCWGTIKKPYKEWRKLVPLPLQPYK